MDYKTSGMKKLFVHIPKTGGTSILRKIDQSMWNKTHYAGHDPYFMLQKQNDLRDVFSFCVVRNPYTRTFSYYNHFKRINRYDCSFIEFLEILKRKIYFPGTRMMYYPQSFYIFDIKGIIGVKKFYFYEKFFEIEEDFGIKFDHLNKGNYTNDDYRKSYDNLKCVELVKELFSVDFLNFGYNLNYE